MRKIIVLLLLTGLIIPAFTQAENTYEMKIEYTAEQIDVPYTEYGFYAVYLVNTTDTIVYLAPYFDVVIGYAELVGNTGSGGNAEVYITEDIASKAESGFEFKPGDRIILYSPIFNPENRERYPHSEVYVRVFVRGREHMVRCLM